MEDEQQAWYDTDEDRAYEDAVNAVKAAVESGTAFDEAASKIDLGDKSLTDTAISDALKLLIAEMHFMKHKSLEEVAEKLKLPIDRVEGTRREMVAEVEADAIQKYKESMGQGGNA